MPRLNVAGAILVREAKGDFALLHGGDRRRRALVRISGALVRELAADGALEELEAGARYRLSIAGRARARAPMPKAMKPIARSTKPLRRA